jgi:hypothetical protein
MCAEIYVTLVGLSKAWQNISKIRYRLWLIGAKRADRSRRARLSSTTYGLMETWLCLTTAFGI